MAARFISAVSLSFLLFPFLFFLFFFLLNSVVPYTTRRLSPPTLISLDSLKDPRPDGFDSYVDMIITFLRPWERKLPEKESLDFGQRFLTKKKKKKKRKKERKKKRKFLRNVRRIRISPFHRPDYGRRRAGARSIQIGRRSRWNFRCRSSSEASAAGRCPTVSCWPPTNSRSPGRSPP